MKSWHGKRDQLLESAGHYYKLLLDGETVEVFGTPQEARDRVWEMIEGGEVSEGSILNIRYSQVGRGCKGWFEPNYEAYRAESGEPTLVYSKNRHYDRLGEEVRLEELKGLLSGGKEE